MGHDERRLRPFAFTGPTLADGIIITHRLPETEAAQLSAMGKVGNFFQLAAGVNPAVQTFLAAQSIDEASCELRAYWMGEPPPRTRGRGTTNRCRWPS